MIVRATPTYPGADPTTVALVEILRAVRSDEAQPALGAVRRQGFDWAALAALAETHRVAPSLYDFIKAHPDAGAPSEVVDRLKHVLLGWMMNRTRAARQFRAVLDRLSIAGVEPVVLKGPVIAHLAYSDPSRRPYGDIDLLIRESQWEAFRDSLMAGGYSPAGGRTVLPAALTPAVSYDHWFTFTMPEHLPIECKFDPLELGLKMRTLDYSLARAQVLDIEGRRTRALALEDQLLTLAVHLNRHGFRRLSWFVDIAGLLDSHGAYLDWDALATTAEEEGLSIVLRETLDYVGHVVGGVSAAPLAPLVPRKPLATAVWRGRWPSRRSLRFDGEQDDLIVFKKSLRSPDLLANALVTGRPGDKATYFLRRAVPSEEYLRARGYGAERYSSMLVLRYLSAVLGSRPHPDDPREHLRPRDPLADDRTTFLRHERWSGPVDVSVIVATYEHDLGEVAFAALGDLLRDHPDTCELVVVSNGPSRVAQKLAVEPYPVAISVLQLDQNYGHPSALNVGARHARGRVLVFLDDDAVPAPWWLSEHLAARRMTGAVAVRGGIEPRTGANSLNEVEFGRPKHEVEPHLLDREGNMSIDRDVFLKANGFDPTIRHSFGPELSYRLSKLGVPREKVVLWPEALIYHDHASGFRDLIRKHYRWSRIQAGLAVRDPGVVPFLRTYRRPQSDVRETVQSPSSAVARGLVWITGMSGRLGWYVGAVTELQRRRG